jgi:hypothetical protein
MIAISDCQTPSFLSPAEFLGENPSLEDRGSLSTPVGRCGSNPPSSPTRSLDGGIPSSPALLPSREKGVATSLATRNRRSKRLFPGEHLLSEYQKQPLGCRLPSSFQKEGSCLTQRVRHLQMREDCGELRPNFIRDTILYIEILFYYFLSSYRFLRRLSIYINMQVYIKGR